MRVLVIGGGGREHALCWKLRQSPLLEELYCAPGNPGIAEIADLVPRSVDEVLEIADFAASVRIDLAVVGPELPLALGIADELEMRGVPVFGPRQAAAEIEGSKVFAKEFMARHGIPTAAFEIAHDEASARAAARRFGFPVVLKADGLAAGKGVILPTDEAELEAALSLFFGERRFGSAANRIVVEEWLAGEEVSFIALADGENVLPLAPSKDYKRLCDGDLGPNTGGMGAHSPAGIMGPESASWVLERVMRPVVTALARENRAFRGFLYAGLMLTPAGLRVLEFNARLGDPEGQVLMLRLEDDLLELLAAGAAGRFPVNRLRFRKEAAACLVLASPGYPEQPLTGEPLGDLAAARADEGVEIFHAGTARDAEGRLVSAGGRVLDVCATGAGLSEALRRAYAAAAKVEWPSKVLRRDIGRRILAATASGDEG